MKHIIQAIKDHARYKKHAKSFDRNIAEAEKHIHDESDEEFKKWALLALEDLKNMH